MNSSDHMIDDDEMNQVYQPMNSGIHYNQYQRSYSAHHCVICGSKSIGMNFGVLSCAPCKVFFRRNARRKELLELPCRHCDCNVLIRDNVGFNERTGCYLQIRRCSSCRLRRCFDVGMKEELVRTEEDNERKKQLIDMNRKQREMRKKRSIPQRIFNDDQLSDEIDWRHLSNIVYAYDTCCLKTFTQQRETLIFNKNSQILDQQSTNNHPTTLTMSIVLAISSFFKSLPAFYSLPRPTRHHLCKTNIQPLIFPTIHELNQSCYSEPWQVAAHKSTWEFICGPKLYKKFIQAEKLAEKLWISDPVVTRLWIIVLFFSTPLHYHYDCQTPTPILKKKRPLCQIQNGYVNLLWKYLLHRHGLMESVRIFLNLVYVYLKMQSVGYGISVQLRTREDLMSTQETLSKLVTLDINGGQGEERSLK